MINKENLIRIISAYIKDFDFINTKSIQYKKNETMGPSKEDVLSHALDRCVGFVGVLKETDDSEFVSQVLCAFTFIQGSLWAIGFYSFDKIMNDIENIEESR